jgi:hypothetical protein
MPRKKIFPELTAEDRFDDMVIEAIWGTTIELRELIARNFEAGRISDLVAINIPGVTREALLITSLVDAESSMVFRGSRLRSKRLAGLVKVISNLDQFRKMQDFPQTSHSSVDKVAKSVDNSTKPVEKSVEKYVEKSTHPVDKFSTIYAYPQNGRDFSTPVENSAVLSPKFSTGGETVDKSEEPLFKDSCPEVIPANLSTLSTAPTTTTIS